MQLTCPTCHASFPLEVALQHEAGREVIAMLAGTPPALALLLMHYIGFFRPAKQQLGWGRALRLLREVLALAGPDVLEHGLAEAGRGLDDKRSAPGWKPLGNHNYLARCLESAQAKADAGMPPAALVVVRPAKPAPQSKAGGAMVALEGMRR